MEPYLSHVKKILTDDASCYKKNRTGVDTISLFGHQSRYDLREGFPLLTTKKLATKAIVEELFWFLRGETNIKPLQEKGVHIWDEWADENGELGPVYGRQWRKWETPQGVVIDQLADVVQQLKKNPDSRRMIVSAWNPADIKKMALPPCHTLWHVNVQDGNLDLQLYQRSADMFLGVPFNIASYSLLAHILANEADLKPRYFIHTFGDSHIYCGAGTRGAFYSEHLGNVKKLVSNAVMQDDLSRAKGIFDGSGYAKVAETLRGDMTTYLTKYGAGSLDGSASVLADHIPLMLDQLSREPRKLPSITVAKKPFETLTIDDVVISDYHPHPHIKGTVAV